MSLLLNDPGHESPLDVILTPMVVVVISGIQAVCLLISDKDLFAFLNMCNCFYKDKRGIFRTAWPFELSISLRKVHSWAVSQGPKARRLVWGAQLGWVIFTNLGDYTRQTF